MSNIPSRNFYLEKQELILQKKIQDGMIQGGFRKCDLHVLKMLPQNYNLKFCLISNMYWYHKSFTECSVTSIICYLTETMT